MAANELSLSYQQLLRHIGREINASRSSADWSSATTQDVADIIADGLRQVYWPPVLPGEVTPHEWSWLQPKLGELTIYPTYSTGTVQISAGGVTLSGGTWPTWAADADLWVSGERYSVSSRFSGALIFLDNTSVAAGAGTSYELRQSSYKLPDDFGGLVRDQSFVLRRDSEAGETCGSPRVVSESMILRHELGDVITGPPELVSFSPGQAGVEDTKWYARFWPTPDANYRLDYRYQVVPPILNGTTVLYHYGGPQISSLVISSCLDRAMRTLYSSDEHYQRFMTDLQAAVRRDRATNKPETLGYGVFSDGLTFGAPDGPALREWRRGSTTIGNINL